MLYFDHDTTASVDDKINALRVSQGGAAVDAYWFLLERMYKEERPLCVRNAVVMHGFAHSLCTDLETLSSWIESMIQLELMSSDEEEMIMSDRARKHIEAFKSKSESASRAAKTRWEKADAGQTQSKRNANAKQPQCQEKKRKEKVSSAPKGSTTKPTASDGADAEGSAPPAAKAPQCPQCGGPLRLDAKRGEFSCAACGSKVALADVGSCLGEVTA